MHITNRTGSARRTMKCRYYISNDRDKALEMALAQIERQFGKGAIMKMGEANAAMQIESIPTGTIALDLALGIGGIPRGRITEIYGPESSGKTTLALHVIAEAQRLGGMRPMSTPSTPLIRCMPAASGSTSTSCSSPSRTPVSRRSRSSTRSSAPARLT